MNEHEYQFWSFVLGDELPFSTGQFGLSSQDVINFGRQLVAKVAIRLHRGWLGLRC